MSDWGRAGTQCVAASGRKKSLETYKKKKVRVTKVSKVSEGRKKRVLK